MRNFFLANIPNVLGRVYTDKVVYDYRDGNKILYISMVAQDRFIPFIKREFNKSNSINISNISRYLNTGGCKYDFIQKKDPSTDYTHLIAYRKDNVFQLDSGTNMLEIPIILRKSEKIDKVLYNKLYALSSIPILEEWMTELKKELIEQSCIRSASVEDINDEDTLKAFMVKVSDDCLQRIISKMLKEKVININETNDKSDIIDMVDGLDSYLSFYGDILANKIQQAFVPKYDPESTEYSQYVNNYDDSCYHNGIELYKAQKSTIQAAVNNFSKNNVTLVIGEMGCGKTAIGAGIAYADYKKKVGMTNIVMCPSHLVNKWKNEIERFVPNSKAYIIKDISDLIALEPKIKALVKTEHTFLILNKETAKSSYEMRPAVNWSVSKKTFVCPCCGQPLTKRVKIGSGRYAETRNIKFDKLDMLSQKAYNLRCNNDVEIIIKSTGEKRRVPCNSLLWTPVNKEDENTKWLKLGSAGWIYKSHIESIYNELVANRNLSKKDRQLFDKVLEYRELIKIGEEYKGMKAPRKYSIARYIRQHYEGYIDYFLADELHLYKGDSKQGQAMADIATVSNKVIGLTGTLLNGYADGLFYILYRLFPRTMKKEGFEYSSEMEFMRQFGVIRRETSFGLNTSGRKGDKLSTNEKRLPGVSPLVFTKFLLENSVFISLSDMDGGLPSYQEYPIGIPMDEELRDAYLDLENQFSGRVSQYEANSKRILGSMLQVLSTYPDMPYNQEEIYNPETNELEVVPRNLEPGIRNKERKLLELIQEKKEKGEKVLVYYEWTNKTDLGTKLPKMLEENGLKVAVLNSNVSADSREEWIEKKVKDGIDVLICNPKLVETGLDLLDFTTIVFYQLGYNIFTMRQASRRSWRLSQTKDIEVYFMYYEGTIQEKAISLMATKLQASMAIEGKFSEEGLRAMSDNEDLLSKIANSVVEGIKDTVEVVQFTAIQSKEREHEDRDRIPLSSLLFKLPQIDVLSFMKRDFEKGRKLSSKKTMFKDLANSKLLVGNLL